MKKHVHRALPGRERIYCWTGCVAPEYGRISRKHDAAHGGATTIDVCRCGAKRASEGNIHRINYGPWIMRPAGGTR